MVSTCSINRVIGTTPAEIVDAYRARRARGEQPDPVDFLPSHDHPHYAEVRRLLIAQNLEFADSVDEPIVNLAEQTVWNKGRVDGSRQENNGDSRKSPAASRGEPITDRVPVQVQSPANLGIDSRSVRRAFGSGSAARGVPGSNGHLAEKLAEALADMPSPGNDFLGFKLLAELGHGAFGRVYLAQQRDLASRYVALKVSTDILGESQALAQLQHTNIVPIYSVHRASPYQAVCMPYFGATTLADLLKNWRERESLPASGLELVSTLCSRKSTVCHPHDTNHSQPRQSEASQESTGTLQPESAQVALPKLGEGQGTAILEMLQGLSFVQAVLWIASRLADGLAHAHERGILHRDLKPANVLLTDEGQPMLLDFSVAEDTKLRSAAAAVAQVGGTLCYMAPEHLEAFEGATRAVDVRSDLYSLGIILYEMLTRRDPFPVSGGKLKEVLPRLIEDRQGPPPRLRVWNKSVSPAVESIVRHCLEPNPARRYQSAHELREDLDRHRADLPLKFAPEPSLRERARKFVRRHPRATSMTSVAVAATVLFCSALAWTFIHGYRLAELEAQDTLSRFHEEAKTAQFLLNARSSDRDQIEEGIKLGRQALGNYGVLDNASWRKQAVVSHLSDAGRTRLMSEIEDLLLLVTRANLSQALAIQDPSRKNALLQTARSLNELAGSLSQDESASRAVLAQRAELLHLLGNEEESRQVGKQAGEMPLRSARDYYLAGSERVALGRYREALPLLQNAAAIDPQNFWAALLLGICHDGLSQDQEARACYTTSIALWPEFPWTYFNRGLVFLRQGDFQNAKTDFDHVIRMRPDLAEVYINRALVWQGQKNYAAGIEDLTHALELGAPHARIYFMRARLRQMAGDQDGSKRDLAEGLRRVPTDEKSWIARGIAKLSISLPDALSDFEKAAELNPRSLAALQNQAHVLSKLGRNDQAIRVLDRVIGLYPDFVPARAGRGVLRARLQQRQAAHQDADDALARDFGPATQYQVAGIYALTSGQDTEDRMQALRYLKAALRKGYGFELLEQDRDLDPIRERPEFRQLVGAARSLQLGPVQK